MNPHTTPQLHVIRSAELRAEAAAHVSYRRAVREQARAPQLRPRLGWALVELGLRLVHGTAAAPRLRMA